MGTRADQIRDILHQKMYETIGDAYLALDDHVRNGLFKAIGEAFEELGWGTGDVPSGGTTGQVLGKLSGTDYHYTWIDQNAGIVDHTALENLSWGSSGHRGSPNTLAGWDEDGNPVEKPENNVQPYNAVLDPFLLVLI